MKRQLLMYGGDMIAEFEETQELKDKVYEAFIKFCVDHDATSGEAQQSDDFQTDAPNFISDLLDNEFEFEISWIEQ